MARISQSGSAFRSGVRPYLTEMFGSVYFAATDGKTGVELWAEQPDLGPAPGRGPWAGDVLGALGRRTRRGDFGPLLSLDG